MEERLDQVVEEPLDQAVAVVIITVVVTVEQLIGPDPRLTWQQLKQQQLGTQQLGTQQL